MVRPREVMWIATRPLWISCCSALDKMGCIWASVKPERSAMLGLAAPASGCCPGVFTFIFSPSSSAQVSLKDSPCKAFFTDSDTFWALALSV